MLNLFSSWLWQSDVFLIRTEPIHMSSKEGGKVLSSKTILNLAARKEQVFTCHLFDLPFKFYFLKPFLYAFVSELFICLWLSISF
jgi:hypothetical protein